MRTRIATLVAVGALAGVPLLVAGPATAANGFPNWGQEVKACNQTSCYPGGGSRGSYVSQEARDGEGPGYAWEIHTLAHPGSSDPSLP